nr:hypothetical protein CFP56_10478 [Quercus suber]
MIPISDEAMVVANMPRSPDHAREPLSQRGYEITAIHYNDHDEESSSATVPDTHARVIVCVMAEHIAKPDKGVHRNLRPVSLPLFIPVSDPDGQSTSANPPVSGQTPHSPNALITSNGIPAESDSQMSAHRTLLIGAPVRFPAGLERACGVESAPAIGGEFVEKVHGDGGETVGARGGVEDVAVGPGMAGVRDGGRGEDGVDDGEISGDDWGDLGEDGGWRRVDPVRG